MGEYLDLMWFSDGSSGLPRRERRGGPYRAYVPDRLADRQFRFDGAVAADVADAEAAILRLDSTGKSLADTEALARILLRAESVASSHIEGLSIGPRRLLRAEASRSIGPVPADLRAEDVLGNIDAMQSAVAFGRSDDRITVDTILEIHRRLLQNTALSEHAGVIREQQNWVGGNEYNPFAAAYVPPPHEFVRELLEDLAEFCNSDMLPAVAQAAIAHAQFETIHPFADGNGRAGRALIHTVLVRRGLARRIIPPISLILATRSSDYIQRLSLFRAEGPPDTPEAESGVNTWVGSFAAACTRAVADATTFEERVAGIDAAWRSRLGRVRAGSSVDLLLRQLPGTPIISVKSAMLSLGRSKPQVNAAVERLRREDVIQPMTVGRRNRAFEAREIIEAFADLERQLGSPEGDTLTSPPARPVPARRPQVR